MKFTAFIASLLFTAITLAETTIVLTRHAEKANVWSDQISEDGQKRALALVQLTHQLDVSGIYVSSAKRTQQTAAPLAKARGIAMKSTRRLSVLRKEILSLHHGKTVVIVGHSNTIPNLIRYLVPHSSPPKIQESDFSNLFIIRIPDDSTNVQLEHYRYDVSPLRVVPIN